MVGFKGGEGDGVGGDVGGHVGEGGVVGEGVGLVDGWGRVVDVYGASVEFGSVVEEVV